jgi:ElaB/YqjD/DUF883 family membrane-anchored ribosome-binding protein
MNHHNERTSAMNMNLSSQRPLSDSVGRVAEHAAQSTDEAIRSTQRVANNTFDRLSGAVQRTPAAVRDTAASAEELAARSAEALREHSHRLRQQALMAGENARQTIQQDPLKSVVMAAAIGAGLAALWMWWTQRPPLDRR